MKNNVRRLGLLRREGLRVHEVRLEGRWPDTTLILEISNAWHDRSSRDWTLWRDIAEGHREDLLPDELWDDVLVDLFEFTNRAG